ncbi:glycosyltransferase family 2 protein [Nocardioides sp. L-11A]|uniref:glycosyltransferase family 2 protein n=1 Tax=Nocardioides sp. L-11A TaxID=3043848 RepID=UPI00249A829F|nr:hypothetical protein QJ852_08755 [Nocardioides sp. L-11A]
MVICPYLHDGEDVSVREAFGVGLAATRHIEFDIWQDVHCLGPERAFQFLWDRHPGRDVVIVHSDMRPMPGRPPGSWYDELLDYTRRFPEAGILACNLYSPPRDEESPTSVVQCAGGTLDGGVISHINGRVASTAGDPGVDPALLTQVRRVPWATFGGVYIRRAVIDACGPFDDRYQWAYVMDADYCLEARARGFEVLQVPVALQHDESRTTKPLMEARPDLASHIQGNTDLFHDKWRGRHDLFSATAPDDASAKGEVQALPSAHD